MTFTTNNTIPIVGELNCVTVPALNKHNQRLIKQHSEITFDLSQVTLSDNAGVGLLVALTSFAKNKGKK